MKILVDMNISPEWCEVLKDNGWEAVHWSSIGNTAAPDTELMAFARAVTSC